MIDATTSQPEVPERLEASPSPPKIGLPPAATSMNKRRFGRFWEWLTRRRALREARGQLREARPRVRELQRRAHCAAELADRVFDALEPLPAGSAKHLAAVLYRQSVYWSLSALHAENASGQSIESLWESARSMEGLKLPWEAEGRDETDTMMRSGDFRRLAELSEVDRQRVAENLRALAHSALQLREPAGPAIRKLLFQRLVRLIGFTLFVAVTALLVAISLHYLTRKPNLALGKPWRTSSVWAECQPEIRTCGGARTDIFFHTQDDPSPWVEFDLGNPTRISEVYVKNRSDAVPDRAVPLVIEVSDDANTWRSVARRDDTFRTWTASFAPLTTRYVRLRVDRRVYFHLDRVEIRP